LGVVVTLKPPLALLVEWGVEVEGVVAGALVAVLDVEDVLVLDVDEDPQPATAGASARQAAATVQSPLVIGSRTLA